MSKNPTLFILTQASTLDKPRLNKLQALLP